MSRKGGQKMFVYTEESSKRTLTPWGKEVKKRLLDRDMKQDDVVAHLLEQGYKINKTHLSNLLCGIGASARGGEIAEINKLLGIYIIPRKGG
jgi:hypothetical protein